MKSYTGFKKNSLLIFEFSIIMILTISSFIMGCAVPSSGYKIFSDKNEICNFSFEYPALYSHRIDGPRVVQYAFGKFFYLGLEPPEIEKTMVVPEIEQMTPQPRIVHTVPSSFSITVYEVEFPDKPGSFPSSVQDMLEINIKRDSNQAFGPDFKILERSTVTVSSVKAERVRYVYNNIMQLKGDKNLMIKDLICFDSDGVIWEIRSNAYEEYAEQAKADFQHVISSFKILD
jgi:hypothetical protein